MKRAVLFLLLALPCFSLSQPVPEWTSPTLQSEVIYSGWKYLRVNPIETRFFQADSVSYRLMTGPFSTTVATTIPLAPSEASSIQVEDCPDVSGDGIMELVIHRQYQGYSRRGFRVVDVLTGQTLFLFDDPNYSYFFEELSDLDHDGHNDLVVYRVPYPTSYPGPYVYQVFRTNGTPTSVSSGSRNLPTQSTLEQNYPNPFNPSTRISYALPSAGTVAIEIFDINGRTIRLLDNQHHEAGSHEITWDGKDNAGLSVASGAYFYRLSANGIASAKKMILLK